VFILPIALPLLPYPFINNSQSHGQMVRNGNNPIGGTQIVFPFMCGRKQTRFARLLAACRVSVLNVTRGGQFAVVCFSGRSIESLFAIAIVHLVLLCLSLPVHPFVLLVRALQSIRWKSEGFSFGQSSSCVHS